MASPMIDLYGEHWGITVDADGNGPVPPGEGTRDVCAECGKPFPCPSSELIQDLRTELAEARCCAGQTTEGK